MTHITSVQHTTPDREKREKKSCRVCAILNILCDNLIIQCINVDDATLIEIVVFLGFPKMEFLFLK